MKYTESDPVLQPSYHGDGCPYNGDDPQYECHCDECDFYLECFPDWDEPAFPGNSTICAK